MTKVKLAARKFDILNDQPSDEDRFGGGGHQRSAKALASSIRKLTNEDGAIGLEGGWGSGKSTVVRLAEKILRTENSEIEYHLLTFDLWAHGMHDIRRPLLEELVAWSSSKKLLHKPAKHYLDKIRDRTELITTKKSNKYNFSGIVALMLAPIMPVALLWLSPFAFREDGLDFATQLSFISIVLYIVLYSAFFIQWRRKGVSDALSISQPDSEIKIEDKNIRERDPATTEFQRIFREILVDIQQKSRRVVIVLDNIDRISEGRIAGVWAEVRSVFAAHEPGKESPKRGEAVTIVVPYDFEHVAKNLSQFESNLRSSQENVRAQSNSAAAEGLIRKSFKVIIRVAPPISADWQDYFYQQADQAITPNLSEAEKFRLFKIYEILKRSERAHPTPRDLINYLNEISVYAEQWQDEMPLEAISLYLSCRSRLSEDAQAIIAGDLVNDYALAISDLGDNWRRYIASLFYNIDITHADRVMLEHRLGNALTDDADTEIVALSKLPNFASALSDIVNKEANDWAKSFAVLDRVATRMATIELSNYQSISIWRSLGSAVSQVQGVSSEDHGSHAGLRFIVRHQSEAREISWAAKVLIDKYSNSAPAKENSKGWEGWEWMAALTSVLEAVEEGGGRDLAEGIASDVEFSGAAWFDVEAISYLGSGENPKWPLRLFSNVPNSTSYLDHLLSQVDADPELVTNVLRARPPFLNDTARTKLIASITQNFVSSPMNGSEERANQAAALTEGIAQLGKLNSASGALKAFLNDGVAVWHIGEALSKEDDLTAAKLIAILALYRAGDTSFPPLADIPNLGSAADQQRSYNDALASKNDTEALSPEIAAIVDRTSRFTHWLNYTLDSPTDPLKISVLDSMIEAEMFGGFDTSVVAKRFDELSEYLSPDNLRHIVQFASQQSPVPLDNLSIDQLFAINSSFIKYIYENSFNNLKYFSDAINEHLLTLNAHEWEDSIKSASTPIKRLIAQSELTKFRPKAQPFKEAIQSHLASIANGEIETSLNAEEWSTLLSSLPANSFKVLVSDLCNSLQMTPTTSAGVKHLADYIPRVLVVSMQGKDISTAIERLIAPLIHSDITAAASLIAQAKPQQPQIGEVARKSLLEAIEDASRGAGAEAVRSDILQICKALNLPTPDFEADVTDDHAED